MAFERFRAVVVACVAYPLFNELDRTSDCRGVASLINDGDPHESSVAVQHDDVDAITFGQAITVGKHGQRIGASHGR